MSRPRRIVLVGRRLHALRAARRLGVEVVRIDRYAGAPGALQEGVVAHLGWPGPSPAPAAWRALARQLPEPARIAAVLGATEEGVVPAAHLAAALGVPGLDVGTAQRCTDKLLMKGAVRSAGLPCAEFVAVGPDTRPEALVERLGLPLVLKPRGGSGTRGQRVVRTPHDLPEVLPADCLAERFVTGVEMSCEALLAGGRVLFENPTEYLVVGEASILPARLDAAASRRVAALHRAALAALGVERGITHTELFLGEEGAVFGEIAARPPGGHLMRLLELAYGFDAWEAWLRLALGEEPAVPAVANRTAGAWVLHPGAGRVRRVAGLAEVATLPGVVRAHVRVTAGDDVPPRLGVGEEVGHLLVVGRNRDETAARLRAARAGLTIEMETQAASGARAPRAASRRRAESGG